MSIYKYTFLSACHHVTRKGRTVSRTGRDSVSVCLPFTKLAEQPNRGRGRKGGWTAIGEVTEHT